MILLAITTVIIIIVEHNPRYPPTGPPLPLDRHLRGLPEPAALRALRALRSDRLRTRVDHPRGAAHQADHVVVAGAQRPRLDVPAAAPHPRDHRVLLRGRHHGVPGGLAGLGHALDAEQQPDNGGGDDCGEGAGQVRAV